MYWKIVVPRRKSSCNGLSRCPTQWTANTLWTPNVNKTPNFVSTGFIEFQSSKPCLANIQAVYLHPVTWSRWVFHGHTPSEFVEKIVLQNGKHWKVWDLFVLHLWDRSNVFEQFVKQTEKWRRVLLPQACHLPHNLGQAQPCENTFLNLRKIHFSILDKYILQF